MPNWVKNTVNISGPVEEIDRLLDACSSIDSAFDFDGIIPMPNHVFQGDLGPEEMEKYPGDLNWYDWSINHWGTKWNAHDPTVFRSDKDKVCIEFETAWACPFPIYEAMMEQYPNLYIQVYYADEDLGNNCGIWENGELLDLDIEDEVEFARSVWGWEEIDEF